MENMKPTQVTYRHSFSGKILTDAVLDWDTKNRTVKVNRSEIHNPIVSLVITFDQVVSFEFAGCVNDLINNGI